MKYVLLTPGTPPADDDVERLGLRARRDRRNARRAVTVGVVGTDPQERHLPRTGLVHDTAGVEAGVVVDAGEVVGTEAVVVVAESATDREAGEAELRTDDPLLPGRQVRTGDHGWQDDRTRRERREARHERGVSKRAVQSHGEVAELVQVVGADVEQVLPGIVSSRAGRHVGGVVVAADAGAVTRTGGCHDRPPSQMFSLGA